MNDTLTLDFERHRRQGFPEVVFGMGKTVDEIVRATTRLHQAHGKVLITRAAPIALDALQQQFPTGTRHDRSGCFSLGMPTPTLGPVAVITAGTADEPVAEEASVTLSMRAVKVERFHDCGVAGIHRIIKHVDAIRACIAVIVVAGMDGALPSVVGGLVDVPLIACPTSIGYGVAAGGHTALNTMLASCSAGVTVVNIDNGFGAGFAAATIAATVARGNKSH
jgi:pyridinium-3,5-biscarboxylic acid mononucleotide synthase